MASYTSKCTTKILVAIASAALVLGLMPSMALAGEEPQETKGTQGEPVANAAPAAVVDDGAQGEDGEGVGGDAPVAEGPSLQLVVAQSEEMPAVGFEFYTYNETNHTVWLKKYNGADVNVVIPGKVDHDGTEYTVVGIGPQSFRGRSGLVSVVMPSSVTVIGDSAFANCTSLKSAEIPAGVTTIEIGAFGGCRSLTSATVPSGVKRIEDQAFINCSALESLTISEGVETIGMLAFGYCTSLKTVEIPASVKSVEGGAFRQCQSLQKVTILSGKTAFGENAFADCPVTDVYYGGTADDWSEVAGKFPNGVKVHYIVTASADPEAGGTVKGAGTYLADAQVTLTATPATGYHFASWTEGGTTVSTDAAYKFSATGSRTLVANFELDKCKVTFVNEDGAELQSGEVEYGKTPAYTGKTPTKAADEKYVYEFAGWTPELAPVTGDATYKAAYTAKDKYACAEGSGQTWTKGSTDPLTLRFKGAADDKATFDLFKGVELDGKAVPEKDSSGNANWTASKGSLILSLQPSYLETLSDGNHTVKALFDDGAGETSFTIAAKATPAADTTRPASSDTAKTGDALPVTPVIATLLLSTCALIISRRKLQVVHPAYRGKHVR